MMQHILIYRHQLFKYSEVFIPLQAESFCHYRPVYAGRMCLGRVPEGAMIETMDTTRWIDIFRQRVFRDHKPILKATYRYWPVLIHAHFGVEGVYALPLAKALDIPLITTFHGFDATMYSRKLFCSLKPAWINYLLFRKQLAKKGDLFLCVSDFIRQKVLDLGFPKERTLTHYIGIDTEKIRPIPKMPSEKIILHVARLVEKKGTKYLLNAFSKIIKRGINAKLVIIGDGVLRHRLIALAKALDINHAVSFLGPKPHNEILEWMRRSSVFCLPSVTAHGGDAEGLGTVLLEASACGIPSVGTWHGGIPEVIQDDYTGCLVPEKDSDILANRLAFLLNNPHICQEMGMNARLWVKEKFNLRKQTEKLEKIYRSLL